MSVMPYFARWCIGWAAPETQTSAAERDCLAMHAAGLRRVVEVGVWHGVTTCRLLEVMAPDGTFLAVDPFPNNRFGFSSQRLIAHRTVKPFDKGRIIWLRMTGAKAASDLATRNLGGIDFIFIDGDHSYDGLRSDWESWSPLIVLGGFVALHDSCSTPNIKIDSAGSVIFTREVIRQDKRFELVKVVDTLTIFRRSVP